MRRTDLYFLDGQGGDATSPGIVAMAKQFETRARVTLIHDFRRWNDMVADVNARAKLDLLRGAVGYSMGGNALTWILEGVDASGGHYPGIKVPFDWCCFLDPTHLSLLTPLGPHCRRALHFHNSSIEPYGHGIVTAGPGFDRRDLEVVETQMSHLALDVDPGIQGRIMTELNERIAA